MSEVWICCICHNFFCPKEIMDLKIWKCTDMKVLLEGRAVHGGRSANHTHNVFADHFMDVCLGNSQENRLKGIPLTNYCNNSQTVITLTHKA